ncbi:MAG: hypothetical protein CMD02_07665 [Flavobacteriales bacterium]|nr:hypothetical protein [Flavobacteriales bacterium]|tara:strand:- start:500 stop:775 length:276 start_codon:yes stop_codon:yes gene_type:complete
MNKLFTLLIFIFFLFFSENVFSQSIKISEKRAKNQIVNGIKVSPVLKRVKAIPVSIISHSSNNKLIEKKKPLKEKQVKKSKYNINKKRDEK